MKITRFIHFKQKHRLGLNVEDGIIAYCIMVHWLYLWTDYVKVMLSARNISVFHFYCYSCGSFVVAAVVLLFKFFIVFVLILCGCFRHHKTTWRFPLKTSSVNLTKSTGFSGFSHNYWKILNQKLHFFVQCIFLGSSAFVLFMSRAYGDHLIYFLISVILVTCSWKLSLWYYFLIN